MTPTEIHALYSPLWEKAPETQPKHAGVNAEGRCWEWEIDDHSIGSGLMLDACRSAVLEWLCKIRGGITLEILDDGTHVQFEADDVFHGMQYGQPCCLVEPSLDHALVAVALKVADARMHLDAQDAPGNAVHPVNNEIDRDIEAGVRRLGIGVQRENTEDWKRGSK